MTGCFEVREELVPRGEALLAGVAHVSRLLCRCRLHVVRVRYQRRNSRHIPVRLSASDGAASVA
jgi:hypothetical protein